MKRALLTLALTALTATTHAESRADLEHAERSFRAGAAAYAAGDYAAAIQALDAAYTLTPLPAIAFSLAQAERRAYFIGHERSHLERAITLFRLYLTQVPSGGRRSDTIDALSQLEPLFATLSSAEPSAPSPADEAKNTRLMITCEAPDAHITLDTEPPAASPLIREVTPGKHRVLVDAAGFHPVEREVTAVQGELILNEVGLEPRPSRLLVSTDLDADIYVDGQFQAQGGPNVSLTLPAGHHELAVAARGRPTQYRDVVLKRGEVLAEQVSLPLTPQRKAARGLFVVSGVGFATSITLALFALRAQGEARDFLSERERGSVSPEALADYHADVAQRNSLRIATDVTLAGAASLFVAGLILHQIDRPDTREIHRHAHSLRGRPGSARPEARLSPWFGRQSAGATLRLAF